MANNITHALLEYAKLVLAVIKCNPYSTTPPLIQSYCVRVQSDNLHLEVTPLIILLYCTRYNSAMSDMAVYNALHSKLLPHTFEVVSLYPYTTEEAWTYLDGRTY